MSAKEKFKTLAHRLFLKAFGPPRIPPTQQPALKFESEWRLYKLTQNPAYFPMIEGTTQDGQKVRLNEVQFFWSALSESVIFTVEGKPINKPLATKERSLLKP